MGIRLTADEVKARYPDEWVLLGDLDADRWGNLVAGTLLYHSRDKADVHREVRAHQPGHFAIYFTGEPSPRPVDTTAVVLNWPDESQPQPLLIPSEEGIR